MADHGGIIWPLSGIVECKYWKPVKGFENGLTGLIWGKGSDSPLSLHADARWVVAEVDADECIAIETHGWIKFPVLRFFTLERKPVRCNLSCTIGLITLPVRKCRPGLERLITSEVVKAGNRSLPVTDDIMRCDHRIRQYAADTND